MKLSVVILVRNEADIILHSIDHARRFFDDIVFVDHSSTDGTLEAVEHAAGSDRRIRLFRLRQKGYFQAEVINLAVRQLFAAGADWAFALDADEYLRFSNRGELEAALAGSEGKLVAFGWRNLAPTEFGDFRSFRFSQAYRTLCEPSSIVKVAISRGWAEVHPRYVISMGNHSAAADRWSLPDATVKAGELLHLPIRSAERLALKTARGSAALAARGRRAAEAQQWFDLAAAKPLSDEELTLECLYYGDRSRAGSAETELVHDLEPGGAPDPASTAKELSAVEDAEDHLQWEGASPTSRPARARLAGDTIVVEGPASPFAWPGDSLARGVRLFRRIVRRVGRISSW
jgi:hypothetical protein